MDMATEHSSLESQVLNSGTMMRMRFSPKTTEDICPTYGKDFND